MAKARSVPFNGKAVRHSFKPALSSPLPLRTWAWLGPWVDVGRRPGPLSVSRLFRYAYNAKALWVACPSRGLLSRQYQNCLRAALRGLVGLASLKLRFKGKSFRWHRRRGSLVLRFGHSHLVRCQAPAHTRWKRGGKAKMLFFSSNLALLRDYLTAVVRWREPNRYHSRGLRLSRQRIMRKAGKVSAYR